MNRKEFTKHYLNILNCPSIGKYPEKEDYLKNEIQQLADIDKISYSLALDKICDAFFGRYLWTDFDNNNFKDIETATVNLLFLRCLEGKDNA